MKDIGLNTPTSGTATTMEEALAVHAMIGKFPLIIRPAFTLGGTGGGIAYNMDEFQVRGEREEIGIGGRKRRGGGGDEGEKNRLWLAHSLFSKKKKTPKNTGNRLCWNRRFPDGPGPHRAVAPRVEGVRARSDEG